MRWRLALTFTAFVTVFSTSRATAQEVATWGTVKGRLVWDGEKIPAPARIANLLGLELFDEQLVVNTKNRGIRHGLVWLMPIDKEPLKIHPDLREIKQKDVPLLIKDYRYHPPVMAIREGQNLLVKTGDSGPYHFRWMANPRVNLSGEVLLAQDQVKRIEGLKAQKLPMAIGSDVHRWMRGAVGIFDHPYFAVTDQDGGFEIKLAPAGRVRVFVWQQSKGWLGGADGRNGYEHVIPAAGTLELGKLKMKD